MCVRGWAAALGYGSAALRARGEGIPLRMCVRVGHEGMVTGGEGVQRKTLPAALSHRQIGAAGDRPSSAAKLEDGPPVAERRRRSLSHGRYRR